MIVSTGIRIALLIGILTFSQMTTLAQGGPPTAAPAQKGPSQPLPPVKKIGDNLVQIGNLLVNTRDKEVTVPGRLLPDHVLEFIACTKMGQRAYESAIEMDTDAISFNLALIMIGLEKSRSVVPRYHFDLVQPEGDPVDIYVEWGTGDAVQKKRVQELLYDKAAKRIPPMGTWVYTGSTVSPDGRFSAEIDGILISFVHDPSSIIENTIGAGIGAYGSIWLNPDLKISPGTQVKVTVKALPRQQNQQ